MIPLAQQTRETPSQHPHFDLAVTTCPRMCLLRSKQPFDFLCIPHDFSWYQYIHPIGLCVFFMSDIRLVHWLSMNPIWRSTLAKVNRIRIYHPYH